MAYTPSTQELDDVLTLLSAQAMLDENAGGRGTIAKARKTAQRVLDKYTPEQIQAITSSPQMQAVQEEARKKPWYKSVLPSKDQVKSAVKVAATVGAGAVGLGMLGGAAAGGGAAGGAGGAGGVAGTTAGGLTALPAGGMAATGTTTAADLALMGGGPAAVAPVAPVSTGILGGASLGKVAGAGLSLAGTLLGGKQAKEAAQETAAAQVEAARIAAEAQKFRPVGVATRFGESKFGYDEQGNLISAGYELSPELRAQQDALMGVSGDYLKQYQDAMGATAPMGAGAQTMMGLGQQYLAKSPEEQAAMYMEQQRALVAPGQERTLAALQSRLQAQGRGGLAIGGTASGMSAANPEMEAYYNALLQQERELAARSTQGGMDYAKFGAGMLGAGGEMLQGMYGTQQAAYQPYGTALAGAAGLEQLGAQPLDYGTSIGAKTTAGTAAGGLLLGQGIYDAAQTTQETRAQNPWADILTGAGKMVSAY